MKRALERSELTKRVKRNVEKELDNSHQSTTVKDTTSKDTTPSTEEPAEWGIFRKTLYRNYVLDRKGLSNLRMRAEAESDGSETDEYSNGGGSRDRGEPDDKSLGGRICPVGTYTTATQIANNKIYEGPFKLVAVHFGPRGRHWHRIYISPNKQWEFNSRLGRTIRNGQFKTKSIDCLTCLREYIYSGDGRQVLQDILGEKHLKACQCAEHNCGLECNNQWKRAAYEADCTEGGDTIFRPESCTPEEGDEGMVDTSVQADDGDAAGHSPRRPYQVRTEAGKNLRGSKVNTNRLNDSRASNGNNCGNSNIIVFLCKYGAFTEGEAMAMFTKTNKGVEFICTKHYAEKIRTYLHVARVLVFQESLKQRFERAKEKFARVHTALYEEQHMEETRLKLLEILSMNEIDEREFMLATHGHFTRQNGKKNNLFFLGPPSTGKTMIMNSLVECHFNYCRLTGLIAGSSFNFSGLLHTNECKLTENQFEQWKMLASGMPMSKDVKYKDRCYVKDCVLYTCSNYPIEMYCKVPMAQQAVDSRTIQFTLKKKCPWYLTIAPHVWKRCWAKYDLNI